MKEKSKFLLSLFHQKCKILTFSREIYFFRAKANPVGKGRSEPNASPFCPEPKGRLQLSLNPFTMIVDD